MGQFWLEADTPTQAQTTICFKTKRLENLSENTLVRIYRSLQLLIGLCNVVVATVRFASHIAAMIFIVVVACFVVIKRGGLMLQNCSTMSYSLGALLAMAIFLPTLICFLECYFVDRLDCAWKTYRKNILNVTSRNTAIHKTAQSFSGIIVKSIYPFCNVNRSTFPEWLSVVVDILVNLLVSNKW